MCPALWGRWGQGSDRSVFPPQGCHHGDRVLTDVADEVVGAVGFASDHAQGLRHHEAVLGGGQGEVAAEHRLTNVLDGQAHREEGDPPLAPREQGTWPPKASLGRAGRM